MKPELRAEIEARICRKCSFCYDMFVQGMDPTTQEDPEWELMFHGATCPGGRFHPDLNRPRKDYVPSKVEPF